MVCVCHLTVIMYVRSMLLMCTCHALAPLWNTADSLSFIEEVVKPFYLAIKILSVILPILVIENVMHALLSQFNIFHCDEFVNHGL